MTPAWAIVLCTALLLSMLLVVPEGTCFGAASDAVRNEASGKSYATVEDALVDVCDGDTVKLLKDAKLHNALECKVPINLDLAGKKMEFDLPDKAIGADCDLITFSGKGSFSLTNGDIVARFSDPTLPASWQFFLSAIKVEGGASVSLADASILMDYTCDKDLTNPPKIAGLRISKGSCVLKGSTSIEITAKGNYPAIAYGVYGDRVPSDNGAILDQGNNASITVKNLTKRANAGNVATDATLTSASSPYLMEFFPDEGSSLYDAIQERFLLKAKADVAEDNEGNVNGLSLYYVAPMKLNDSNYVWAFSSTVPKGAIGLRSSVKAARFFGQSHYDKMPVTTGICITGETSDDGKSHVSSEIGGRVSASSENGVANAIVVKGSAKASVLGNAALSADGTDEPYREVGEALTAASLTGNLTHKDRFYPTKQSLAYEVRWVRPISCCVSAGSSVSIEDGASVSKECAGDEPKRQITLPEAEAALPNDPKTVKARFYHWKPLGSQTVYAYTQLTLDKGTDATSQANALVRPGTVTYHDDKVEAFLGWSVRRSDREPLYTDALPHLQEDVDYHAIYSQRERLISVSFMVNGKLYSLANSIPAGKTVDYAFRNSSNSKKPGASKSGGAFRGWSLTPGGQPVTQVVKRLMELVDAEHPLTLHAVYYPAKSDTEKKTLSPIGATKGTTDASKGNAVSGNSRLSSLKGALTGLRLSSKSASDKDASNLEDTEVIDEAVEIIDGEEGVPEGLEEFRSDSETGEGSSDAQGDADPSSGFQMSGNALGFFVMIGAIVLLACAFAWNIASRRMRDKDGDCFDSLSSTGEREVCF